jgi:hypothetical protein
MTHHLSQSDATDRVWIAPWADSGPYGGWRRGQVGHTAGLGSERAALVPRELVEAYEAACEAQDAAELALDEAARRYWKDADA